MARTYTVAIVGRPNVGKSALFNRMVGADASIVHKQSGVTRDRLYGTVAWEGKQFTLLDTGGLDLASRDDMVQAIQVQVEQAIKEADALLFVVDARSGLTPEDIDVAEVLRKTQKPLLLVANKCDVQAQDVKSLEFYRLGFGDVWPVSAAHGLGFGDLLDRLFERLVQAYGEELEPAEEVEEGRQGPEATGDAAAEEHAIRVAVVGKPNVGKSSLVNALLGDERMTVSKKPGTTVDAVDTPFQWRGTDFVLVDTAGLRRPKMIGQRLEELSVGRALTAIKRADVAVLVVDATSAPSAQERRIAGYIERNARASIIAVNKVDLGIYEGASKSQFKAAVLSECRPIDYSEVLFVSCLTGSGVDGVLPEVLRAYGQYGKRIETSLLNEVVSEIAGVSPPPKEAKFYYATQVGEKPPRMIFFVKDPAKVTGMYKRYVEGGLRKRFDFKGAPIVMEFRERQRSRKK
jgi:GTP-binding protein